MDCLEKNQTITMYGDLLSVFGGIFLIMTIIGGTRMQKEVTYQSCGEDVKDVENNLKWYKRLLWLWGSVTAIGLILLLLEYVVLK